MWTAYINLVYSLSPVLSFFIFLLFLSLGRVNQGLDMVTGVFTNLAQQKTQNACFCTNTSFNHSCSNTWFILDHNLMYLHVERSFTQIFFLFCPLLSSFHISYVLCDPHERFSRTKVHTVTFITSTKATNDKLGLILY